MSARRVTVPDGLSAQVRYRLDAATSHYVGQVLRLAAGDPIDVMDGEGVLWRATLGFDGTTAWVEPGERASVHQEPPLVLVAALTKQSAWEWAIEKATELGATAIQPWEAARSVVKLPPAKRAAKQARWQKICDGATRQSEQLWRLEVRPTSTLEEALRDLKVSQWIVLDEGQRDAAWTAIDPHAPTALVVGPEGGLTDAERALLRDAGAHSVGLGDAILRAETASLAALSALRFRRAGLLP